MATANGISRTTTGCGSDRGPSHQVPMPSSTLVFHTAVYDEHDERPGRDDRDPPGRDEITRLEHAGRRSGRRGERFADGFHEWLGVRHGHDCTGPGLGRGGETIVGGYPHGPCPRPLRGARRHRIVPFAKLSIFYPMWNEQEYIERALARRTPCL